MDGEELRNVAAGSPPPYTPPPAEAYSAKPRPPPPSGYYQTPSSRGHHGYSPLPNYAPPPPVVQQQSNNTNVVVVGQQPQPQQQVVHVRAPRANTYMALTAVLMVICFCHGNLPAFLCLIPALICACVASDHNSAGEYSSAKDCGAYALCCNIFSVLYYVLLVIAGIVLVVIYFTIGLHIANQAINNANSDIHINIPSIEPPTTCSCSWWDSSCYCN